MAEGRNGMTKKESDLILKRYEDKLKELMSSEEFNRFSTEIAKELFKADIDSMAQSDFKDFCVQNFDRITGGSNEN